MVHTDIKKLLQENKIDEAIRILEQYMNENPDTADNYYLLGNAYRKKSDFRNALNYYLKAIELDPESPACEAYKMTMDILNFYNKDMFNH